MNEPSLALVNPGYHSPSRVADRAAWALIIFGIAIQLIYWIGNYYTYPGLNLSMSVLLITSGSLWLYLLRYRRIQAGIQNHGIWQVGYTSRGIAGWILSLVLTGFYIILYWFPHVIGYGENGNAGLVKLFDPLSYFLKGSRASQWFVYGVLYTWIILLTGIRFIIQYRHVKYQQWRTVSVIFFQVIFAFLLPEVLTSLNLPFNDFKNIWPLNYYFFFSWHIDEMIHHGTFGYFVLFWGITCVVILTPVLTYFFGKRWYCSWVCGCGGLAETAGDPFRHLSSSTLKSWKIERWLIHFILIWVVLMTAMVLYTRWTGHAEFLFLNSYKLSQWYGFLIGSAFSGVIGVGFYPLMGSRVWCRFGCPMAAILGLWQRKASRFRITSNGGQCISCGNCSTYCEMGIDVKSYAQKSQDIVRASCVGCGICSAVCPRGVLRLENASVDIHQRGEIIRHDKI